MKFFVNLSSPHLVYFLGTTMETRVTMTLYSVFYPGPSFGGGGSRGSENVPQQHLPESTILHQCAAELKKIPGACLQTPLPPKPRFSFV